MNLSNTMRIFHRYLGFFLSGIMAMYAITGIVMIFRTTDFLKSEQQITATIASGLKADEIGKALKIKELKVISESGDIVTFAQGTYNRATGEANYSAKQLPYLLEKMTKVHKATSNDPLYFLNIFFGIALLFFVVSSFWMFAPSSSIFRKGIYFAIGGFILALILIFV